jgi:hypothetical protein
MTALALVRTVQPVPSNLANGPAHQTNPSQPLPGRK